MISDAAPVEVVPVVVVVAVLVAAAVVAGCVVAAPLSPLSPPHPASRPVAVSATTVMRTGTLTGAPCDAAVESGPW